MEIKELTCQLIRFDTTTGPEAEKEIVKYLGQILHDHGYCVRFLEFEKGRPTLVAELNNTCWSNEILCLSGHMDTVPTGKEKWEVEPFKGEVCRGKIYGRGASDMKSGLVAMLFAAIRIAKERELKRGITLIFTAGEEIFCKGARHLVAGGNFNHKVGAMIVGEPTSNNPWLGHKGALHYKVITKGISAHASMPHLGENAIYKAAEMVLRLRDFNFNVEPHPLLGAPTLNVGTISGGININSVPDRAEIGIDIRIIPGQRPERVTSMLEMIFPEKTEITLLDSAEGIFTPFEHPWVKEVFDIVKQFTGKRPEPAGAPYFTDASVLTPYFGNPPTIILGPGEPDQAHKANEYCYISKIEEAVEIYTEIMKKWCKGGPA